MEGHQGAERVFEWGGTIDTELPGAEPPAGVQGRSPWWWFGGKAPLENFYVFAMRKKYIRILHMGGEIVFQTTTKNLAKIPVHIRNNLIINFLLYSKQSYKNHF